MHYLAFIHRYAEPVPIGPAARSPMGTKTITDVQREGPDQDPARAGIGSVGIVADLQAPAEQGPAAALVLGTRTFTRVGGESPDEDRDGNAYAILPQ
jgi:hypothetical protein